MHRVYSTNSFAIASLLGGPIAAAYMVSSNYTNFGEAKKSRLVGLISLVVVVAVFFGAAFLLDSIDGLQVWSAAF